MPGRDRTTEFSAALRIHFMIKSKLIYVIFII